MVVNKSDKEKEAYPDKTCEEKWAEWKETRCKKARKCCFKASVFMNLLLLAGLITTGVFMCRYKREVCQLKVDHAIAEMERNGFEYEVRHCDVVRIYGEDLSLAEVKAEHLGCDVPTIENNPVKCGGFYLFIDGHMEDDQGREVMVD